VSSVYERQLPSMFPYMLEGEHVVIFSLVNRLMTYEQNDPPTQNGSSFAVTADGRQGYWRLWLSEASETAIRADVSKRFEDNSLQGTYFNETHERLKHIVLKPVEEGWKEEKPLADVLMERFAY
jgi:hypothetical protein